MFEHVADPFAAAAGLWHLLKPGGLVFLHAPFSIHIHGKVKDTARGESFGDYFRYTLAGAERVFLNAGFEILASEMTGNPMLAIGLLMGFGSKVGVETTWHVRITSLNHSDVTVTRCCGSLGFGSKMCTGREEGRVSQKDLLPLAHTDRPLGD